MFGINLNGLQGEYAIWEFQTIRFCTKHSMIFAWNELMKEKSSWEVPILDQE